MYFWCICPLFCLIRPAWCHVVEGIIPEKCLLAVHGLLWKIENTHLCTSAHARIPTHPITQGQTGCGVKGVVFLRVAPWEEMSAELGFGQWRDID